MLVRPAGERSLLLEVDDLDDVHHLWGALRREPPAEAEDIVAGERTVLVILRRGADRGAAEDRLRARAGRVSVPRPPRDVTIRVVYDGPDLDGVAAVTGLGPEELISLHTGASHMVAFLGFSPGFAYLTGLPPELHIPRLDSPRTSVPAGSVAIAAGMTAVYPQSTPGGWRLIGRSDAVMFDAGRPSPALLEPGDRIRFLAVDRLEDPALPRPSAPWAPVPPGQAYIQVLEAGALTTIQDAGRPGWAHLGVPVAGAADRAAAVRANLLVGNPAGEALLEATLTGPTLRMGADRCVAVTGADADIRVDGFPARHSTALRLAAGGELAVGRFRAGARAYLAVAGGISATTVLGSRSADTLSGLGPRPLRPGDRLPVGEAREGDRRAAVSDPAAGSRADAGTGPLTVTAYRGPRDDWVGAVGVRTLATAEFQTLPSSDRTGLRLAGPPVQVRKGAQLPSEGMAPGAIQIPPDGQPIVLLRNHPTTGGYPVAAVVSEAGIDLLAQARPGTRIRFELV